MALISLSDRYTWHDLGPHQTYMLELPMEAPEEGIHVPCDSHRKVKTTVLIQICFEKELWQNILYIYVQLTLE